MGKMIRRQMNKDGFTLAEVMLAVAIIIILMGVAFVGVSRYLRSMGLLERDGVAKEIFVAAQNHLTMAQGQGYLNDKLYYGQKDTSKGTVDAPVYLIAVNSTTDFKDTSIAGIMLPFGSMEETIRANGNYVIRYQPRTAKVLDVFYCTNASGRYDSALTTDMIQNISIDYKDPEDRREEFTGDDGQDAILGWFGGENADTLTLTEVKPPTLDLVNDDILYAMIHNPNEAGDVTLQVFVEGVSSGISGYFEFPKAAAGDIPLVLDDITNKERMISNILKSGGAYQISDTTKTFIPGEDIRVYVKAFIPDTICNIEKSATKTENSLFEAIDPGEPGSPTVSGRLVQDNYTTMFIGSFRHLENLNSAVSGLAAENTVAVNAVGSTNMETKFNLTKAVQTKDLTWYRRGKTGTPQEVGYVSNVRQLQTVTLKIDEFKDTEPHVYTGTGNTYTGNGYYLPISPAYPLEYDGGNFKISDVCVDHNDNAGLVGRMEGGSFANLRLENFEIKTSSGNAGALGGYFTTGSTDGGSVPRSTDITNVIAYNSNDFTAVQNITVSGGNGSAGGLIGQIDCSSENADYGDVDSCAAALYVSSTGSAGGLIGKISGPMTLRKSYSGGHTLNAGYSDNTVAADAATKGLVNVISGSGANAGGLIGECDAAKIQNCYSTCSASGGTAGGLIGTSTGSAGTVTNCYATGLVKGSDKTKEGAFAGILGGSASECNYYEIINERKVTGATAADVVGYEYLKAVGGETGSVDVAGIIAFDADVTSYNDFITGAKPNANAVPYDSVLGDYYQDKYYLKTVAQLGSTVAAGSYVEKHYGDWPAPEIFVINE